MRIVSGQYKGKKLVTPKSDKIRPTSDRTRETIFDVLTHKLEIEFNGRRVLDLFCGTGALGLEAISRGAEFALFVDKNPEARGIVRRNIEQMNLTGKTKVFGRDIKRMGKPNKKLELFDIVFADPPYNKNLINDTFEACTEDEWIQHDAIIVAEESSNTKIEIPKKFKMLDRRILGETQIIICQYKDTM